MTSRTKRIPKYRHHIARNLAKVCIDGKEIYLGEYNSPGSLRAYDQVIGEWLSKGTVSSLVGLIKRIFRWGVIRKYVVAAQCVELDAVENLKGIDKHIRPIDDSVVECTLPHLPDVVARMVKFQRLTGCRPGEVRTL